MVWGLIRNLTFTPMYAAHCLSLPWHTFYKAIVRGCVCVVTVVVVSFAYRAAFPVNSWLTLIVAGCVCSLVAGAINLFVAFNGEERRKFQQLVIKKIHR